MIKGGSVGLCVRVSGAWDRWAGGGEAWGTQEEGRHPGMGGTWREAHYAARVGT